MVTALVAEDDGDLRRIIHDLLASCGYTVLEASDGREAMVMIKGKKPDILILDLAMPEIDGWQLAQMLRKSPATKNLPIIALTAHAMADDCERALRAGCSSYLAKPFILDDLTLEINRLLKPPSAA